MNVMNEIKTLFEITQASEIARRYFVTNGFDAALTVLGLMMGFRISGDVSPQVAIGVCLGTAIALGISGLSSTYLSETAERQRALRELENAMIADLSESTHSRAARVLPILISLISGLSPFMFSLLIMTPLWLKSMGLRMPLEVYDAAIAVAFLTIFLLGVFLGNISGRFWLWSGLRTTGIALFTAVLIQFVLS